MFYSGEDTKTLEAVSKYRMTTSYFWVQRLKCHIFINLLNSEHWLCCRNWCTWHNPDSLQSRANDWNQDCKKKAAMKPREFMLIERCEIGHCGVKYQQSWGFVLKCDWANNMKVIRTIIPDQKLNKYLGLQALRFSSSLWDTICNPFLLSWPLLLNQLPSMSYVVFKVYAR